MPASELHVVTGAFGFSGKYITSRLLKEGHRVRTLTDSPQRANPFAGQIEVHPFNFNQPDRLVESLRGASVFYNTYWVRFSHADFRQASAVENTLRLFVAAKCAGVRRVVHVSITNPSEESRLEYFRTKALLERALIESGLSYAILRPAVLFGAEDVLINNIAWTLRHLPVFGVFGDGFYRLQPIYVDDFAQLAVEQGRESANRIIDAVGPETFTYRGLVSAVRSIIRQWRPIVSVPPELGYWASWCLGRLVGDVVVTREEIEGLMQELLYTASPATGTTKLTEWAAAHADTLGRRYASELARRRNHRDSYDRL